MLVNQSKHRSDECPAGLSLPWAWHSSAPACLYVLFSCQKWFLLDKVKNNFCIGKHFECDKPCIWNKILKVLDIKGDKVWAITPDLRGVQATQ